MGPALVSGGVEAAMHRGTARNWIPGCPRCAMHGESTIKTKYTLYKRTIILTASNWSQLYIQPFQKTKTCGVVHYSAQGGSNF